MASKWRNIYVCGSILREVRFLCNSMDFEAYNIAEKSHITMDGDEDLLRRLVGDVHAQAMDFGGEEEEEDGWAVFHPWGVATDPVRIALGLAVFGRGLRGKRARAWEEGGGRKGKERKRSSLL